MVKLRTTKIVGSSTETTWAQTQTILGEDGRELWVVLKIKSEEDATLIDLATLGAETLTDIEKKSEGIADISGLEKLVKETVEGAAEGLKIEMLVARVADQKIDLYGVGEVGAYLARGGELARLKDVWGEGEGISGDLKDGDTIVLSTAQFVEQVGIGPIKEILTGEDEPAELLAPLVHTQADSSGVAAIVGVVKGEKRAIVWPQIKLRLGETPKMSLWIPASILVLLILMIGVGMVRKNRLAFERDFQSLNTSVEAKIAETISVGDLNPERARILLTQAKAEVEQYLDSKTKDQYKERARKLLVEIEETEDKAFKKNEVQLSTVVELGVLEKELEAEKMKSDGHGNLVFLDTKNPRVVSMNLMDRSRQTFELSQDSVTVDLGVSEAKTLTLESTGATELDWKNKTVKQVIEGDEFWKQPTLIQIFAGNAYIFDLEQSEIWKYPTLGETYGGRRRWLAGGITPDLSKVIDMKVVGDIWLLTSSGKLERYSRGAPVTFSMEGFPAKSEAKRLADPKAMWVSEELVYVLENGAERVVVFGEDGKYKSQYVNSEFSKASDLVVVDDKGYVLIDNVVKEFSL